MDEPWDGSTDDVPVEVKTPTKSEVLPDLESQVPEAKEEPSAKKSEKTLMDSKPQVTETLVKKTTYSADQVSPLTGTGPDKKAKAAELQDFHGVLPQYHQAVKHLADLAKSGAQKDLFTVHIIRKSPAVYEGYRLPVGDSIEQMKPMELRFIRDAVVQLHGGGTYSISLVSNETGQEVSSIPLDIDQNRTPPRPGENAEVFEGGYASRDNGFQRGRSRYASFQGNQNPLGQMMAQREAGGLPGFATLGPQNQDVVVAVNAERANKAKILEIQSQMQLKEAEAKQEEQTERLAEARTSRSNRGRDDDKTAEVMRSEMREMFNGFKDLVVTVLSSNSNKGKDTSEIQLLTKAMETSSTNTIESMKAMMTLLATMMTSQGGKGTEIAEAMKLAQQANEKVVDMALKGSGKFDKMIEAMFLGKMNQNEEGMERMIRLMAMGREQEREAFKLAAQFHGGDDGDVLDPDQGFTGNLGNMVLRGIGSAVSGLAKGGFSKITDAIMSARGAQPGGGTYTPMGYNAPPVGYLPQPQAQMQQMQQMQQPQQMQQMQQPQQPHYSMPQQQPVQEEVYDSTVEADIANAPSVAVPSPEVQIGDRIDDRIIEFPLNEARQHQQSPQEPSLPPVDESAEERLREYVTETMEIALEDLQDGRREHSWPEHALGKWSRPFLEQVLHAPDDHSRLKLLESKCHAEVFSKLGQRLASSKEEMYNFFIALRALLTGYAKVANHGMAA